MEALNDNESVPHNARKKNKIHKKRINLKNLPLLWSLLPLMMLLNEIRAEGFVILIVAGVFEATTPTRPVGQVWSNAIL